jgi:hypothetical protein
MTYNMDHKTPTTHIDQQWSNETPRHQPTSLIVAILSTQMPYRLILLYFVWQLEWRPSVDHYIIATILLQVLRFGNSTPILLLHPRLPWA